MTEQELQDFKARVKYAHFHHFGIGKAAKYAADLVDEGASPEPPKGAKKHTTSHFLAMIGQVEKSFAGSKPALAKSAPPPKPKAEAKPKAEPKSTHVKVEIKADVKAEPRDSSDFTSVLEELTQEVKDGS
jgi:hypothetical protein